MGTDKKEHPTVLFNAWVCKIVIDRYANNDRICMNLVCNETGEPIATATTNIPGVILEPREVLIKDYSENEGMVRALKDAGIIEYTGRYVQSGFAHIPICRLLIDIEEEGEEDGCIQSDSGEEK